MRADDIRVAVRPRSTLECLDLAALVCGRRPLAVALAAAGGALPCIAVNRALFAGVGDEALLPACLALGVEAPWAAVPLTLYLGQAVFSDRFSGRAALRSFLGGLPALVVFQGVLRAVCIATLVLAPVAFVTMYHLDQVILLERPALSSVWSRRGAVNRGTGKRLVSLALWDCLGLVLGTFAGANFLAAVAGLWRGGPATHAAADLVGALMSWPGQIAFWSACGFLTIVRFFTYLDGRIRREGWDVELRLRAEETYAGLPRPDARRPGTAAVALMAAMALLGGAGAAHAADDSRGSTARQAIARQSFPWYDAAADRYRPLLDPGGGASKAARTTESSETTSRGRSGGTGSGRGTRGGGAGGAGSGGGGSPPPPPPLTLPEVPAAVGQGLLVVLLVLVVGGLVVLVVRHGLGHGADDAAAEPTAEEPAPEPGPEEALPAGIRRADGDLLGRCAAEADRGDFAAAMLLFHAWLLVDLHRRGIIALARGKTNGQYAREVAAAAPALADLFRTSSRLFEDAFFGRLPVDRADFLAVWEHRDLDASLTAPAGGAT